MSDLSNLVRGLAILQKYINEDVSVSTGAEGLFINVRGYDLIPTNQDQERLTRIGWQRLVNGYIYHNPGRK